MSFKGVLRDMLAYPRAVAGLSCLWAWLWLLFWSRAFSLRPLSYQLADLRWLASLVVCALALGALAFTAGGSADARRRSSALRVVGSGAGMLGTALVAGTILGGVTLDSPVALYPLVIFSALLSGLGQACLMAQWCALTCGVSMRLALAVNAAASLVGGLAFLVLIAVPAPLAMIVGMALPAMCGLLARRDALGDVRTDVVGAPVAPASVLAGDPSRSPDEPLVPGLAGDASGAAASLAASIGGEAACAPRAREASPGSFGLGAVGAPTASLAGSHAASFLRAWRPQLSIGLLAVLFGFSFGFTGGSYSLVPAELYYAPSLMVVLAAVLAAGLILVTAFAMELRVWQLMFQVSLPLMGVAYLLMPDTAYLMVGPGIHALGYQYFFIAYWSLLSQPEARAGATPHLAAAVGMLAVQAGQALGLAGWDVLLLIAGHEPDLRAVSIVAVAVVLVVSAALIHRPAPGDEVVAWENDRPGRDGSPAGAVGASLEDCVSLLARQRGLSTREEQVCVPLGRGRNRSYVAERLGISLETAKTHATNVYRKLGIHSQQELLDAIDQAGRALAEGAAGGMSASDGSTPLPHA